MLELKGRLGRWIGNLSLREQVTLLVLLGLLVISGADLLLSRLYLEPRRALHEAVAEAAERIRHHEVILSRGDWIESEYRKLDEPAVSARDSVLTETAVLRRLSGLGGQGIHVTSVVPRPGVQEGRRVLVVALDFEGSLAAVSDYLARLLKEMPVVVDDLSLSPRAGEAEGVACRTTIRIEYRDS